MLFERCHSPPPLRWGLPIEKAVSGEYNPPLRMYGRADDEVIDQPTLFKRHVKAWRTECSVGRIHFACSEGGWGPAPQWKLKCKRGSSNE